MEDYKKRAIMNRIERALDNDAELVEMIHRNRYDKFYAWLKKTFADVWDWVKESAFYIWGWIKELM